MKIPRKILTAFQESQPEAIYTFITLSASLIFGIFAWRQRLLLFPLSFSLNIFGCSLGSHIVY